jgi:PAS domain S-box-containing protein
MDASRTLPGLSFGVPVGAWRWASLGFSAVALASAGLALSSPVLAGWAGYVLLLGIAVMAGLFFYAAWPRPVTFASDARRVAEAAAKANVAWAITGADGAVIDCNPVYRRMAGAQDGDSAPPPELALVGEASAAVLYRLARDAGEGKPREETFPVVPGLEIVAAVRPMDGGMACWWFTPRLSLSTEKQPVLKKAGPQADPAEAGTPPPAAASPTAVEMGDLVRHAPMGVAFTDASGVIVEANTAFAQFFGLDSVQGQKPADLAEEADRDAVTALVAKAVEGTAASGVRLRKTGPQTERTGKLFAGPARDGRAILYLSSVVDVSEQKAHDDRSAQAQKLQAVGQLAGGVAHDFNNLLTVIIGNCEFLLMRHQAGDSSFKEINEVHQNALRAATLVGQLLAFSRKQTMQPKVLALSDVVGELAHMLRRLLREGITLKVERTSDLWPVHADEAQLTNAIINLVVNARDAMPGGGTVTIKTANESLSQSSSVGAAVMLAGDYVRLEVADTGTGMSKDIQSKIFDPFFTTKPVGQGTGLGLATVYGIVKQSDGYITVDSEVGRGTTFNIYLPRHKLEPGAAAQTSEPVPAQRDVTGQGTILLVEDEDAVRSFAVRALKLRGYNVLEASGGEEALEIVRSEAQQIDLLVTDVVMPNMDGPTLVRHAKGLRPGLPVIFMSGYAEEAFRRNDEKAEDLHFLPKPFGLKQLAAKVKEVLAGSTAPKRVG